MVPRGRVIPIPEAKALPLTVKPILPSLRNSLDITLVFGSLAYEKINRHSFPTQSQTFVEYGLDTGYIDYLNLTVDYNVKVLFFST